MSGESEIAGGLRGNESGGYRSNGTSMNRTSRTENHLHDRGGRVDQRGERRAGLNGSLDESRTSPVKLAGTDRSHERSRDTRGRACGVHLLASC